MTIDPTENPNVDHRIRKFLQALNSSGGKPIETLTPAETRKVLVDAQASVPLELPRCDVEEKTITRDGLEVNLNIVRPAGSKVVLPGFIFVHGGGWVLGDFPTHEHFVRDLVADSGFTAIFANYTPSPEAHYPLIQVAGNDVLRDGCLAYGRKLDSAGEDVTMVRDENLIHGYGLLNAIRQVPAVRDPLHQTAEMLKKHL
jgi:acetyl esterase/lipase